MPTYAFNPRWFQTTSTTGTGDITLDGAPPAGRNSFRTGLDDGGETCVWIGIDGSNVWEISRVRIVKGGSQTTDVLQRLEVFANHVGTTTKINLPSGTKNVYPIASHGIFATTHQDGRIIADDGVKIPDGAGGYWDIYRDTSDPSTVKPVRVRSPDGTQFAVFQPASDGNPAEVLLKQQVNIESGRSLILSGQGAIGTAAFKAVGTSEGDVLLRGTNGRVNEGDLPAGGGLLFREVVEYAFFQTGSWDSKLFDELGDLIGWRFRLRCLTSELGYNIGQHADCQQSYFSTDATTSGGIPQMYVRVLNTPQVADKANAGQLATVTLGNWALQLVAWGPRR